MWTHIYGAPYMGPHIRRPCVGSHIWAIHFWGPICMLHIWGPTHGAPYMWGPYVGPISVGMGQVVTLDYSVLGYTYDTVFDLTTGCAGGYLTVWDFYHFLNSGTLLGIKGCYDYKTPCIGDICKLGYPVFQVSPCWGGGRGGAPYMELPVWWPHMWAPIFGPPMWEPTCGAPCMCPVYGEPIFF